jgi:hypothetical protein
MPPIPELSPDIRVQLLPPATKSVKDVIPWTLPNLYPLNHSQLNIDSFFSENDPNCPITDILNMPAPPTKVINVLRRAYEEREGVKSICCPYTKLGLGKRYPPMLLSYWKEQYELRYVQAKFNAGVMKLGEHLRDLKLSELARARAEQALELLEHLPWAGTIAGFSPGDLPIVRLASFLNQDWLTGEQIDMLIALLQSEIALSHEFKVYLPGSTSGFSKKLVTEYELRDKPDHVPSSWLGKVSDMVRESKKDVLGFVANVRNNHWVAIAIDVKYGLIWHGDPMMNKIDYELEQALRWWASKEFAKEFVVCDMPVVEQGDGYSCGVLAWCALRAFLLPKSEPKAATGKDAYDARVSLFIDIVKRHHSFSLVRHFLTVNKSY